MVLSESMGAATAADSRLIDPKPARVIAVTGGKGGVGKTNICANLGITLARRGHDVMLLDADLGLANVEILLGLRSNHNLSHVLSGERELEEIIVTGPGGMKIVPGSSGIARMAALSSAEQAGLVQAFSALRAPIDFFLVDTAAGISADVITFTRAAQEVVVVVCDEPASLTDAYALIKVLSRDHGVERFHIVANMVSNTHEGRKLFQKLASVTDRFLEAVLTFLGTVPYDEQLRKAVQRQSAVADAFPRSRAAASFNQLASVLESWPRPELAKGHLEFFMERVVQAQFGEPR
jgi:flagellar biosynthesis protein FlhG